MLRDSQSYFESAGRTGRTSYRRYEARMSGGAGGYRAAGVVLAVALAAGVALILIVGVRKTMRSLFAENPVFALRTLDISSNGRLTRELIKQYAGLDGVDNVFGFDLARARAELMRVPLVKDATLRRELPGRVTIRVLERAPLARMPMPGASLDLAIDREGFVIGPSAVTPGLPQLKGVTELGVHPGSQLSTPIVLQALDLIETCDRARLSQAVRIVSVDVSAGDHFLLTLAGGERARLPARDFEMRLRRLADMLRSSSAMPRTAETVEFNLMSDKMGTASGFVVPGVEPPAKAPARRRSDGRI